MKKIYLIALFAFVCNFASAQIEQVAYRGAFAPSGAMWTDSWTNFDPQTTAYADATTVVNVSGDITANTTWTTGKTYKLTGLVFVKNNATLTIQAGVVIKGVSTTTGTALIVTRGAKLNAIGTATSPIVFTSDKAAGTRAAGDWGGVILLGRATYSSLVSGNTGVNNIEGITASADTQYGGGTTPNDNDNSGILRYVRIEFGGYVFSANNEINGLTMGAVGRGTTIDYVQTSFTNDDSFEWFGGAVNCKHLVAYRGLDDDFDTDNGYKGFVQFALGIKDPAIADNPAVSESEGFESDNNPSSVTVTQSGFDNTSCVFSNCTLIGPSGRGAASVNIGHRRPARLRRNTELKLYNSIFMDFRTNRLFVDGSGAVALANANKLKFQNNIIAGVADGTFTAGVEPTSLNSWFTTNGNTYTTSAGILAAPYSGTPLADYTGDFRPGTLAATGASFTDPSIAALLAPAQTFDPKKFETVGYRGAFAPAPAAMWTDNWTNFDPQSTQYTDEANVVTVSANITTNTTWTAGTTYKLADVIYVTNNAILTIEPGVVIKGLTTTTGTALVITKGAKLNAIGTVTQPIVFTSNVAAGSRAPGNWGGVVLLGNARFTSLATGNTGVNNIEGITVSANTQYGGGTNPNDADDSGTLKYVRIEFGGFVFSTNNEINGLTMGAVGSGTTIDYVQTSFTNDDSFEWFGGAVNCKHLVAYRGLDDDFDTDNGYKGRVQFALGIKDPAIADNPSVSTSEGFESDNNANTATAEAGWDNTSAIFSNCTLIGSSGRGAATVAAGHQRPARLRRATQLKLYNSIFMDFKTNYLLVDGPVAVANALAGTLKFQNNIIAGTPDATYTSGVRGASASDLTTWFSTNNNTYTASTGILTAPYSSTPYTGTPSDDFTGDFRPGTLASTGAKFDDASIAPVTNLIVPAVTNLTICQGATGLSPLTAVPTFNGVSLRWYTSATTTAFSTTAPTPSSSTVGTKTYYVADVSASGSVSGRAALTVTVLARPTVGLGAITGTLAGLPASTSVGVYIGTATQFVYSVAPSTEDGVTSYLWTVPNGVNIIGASNGSSITVNFLNVPAGSGFVGTILAQAVNSNNCPGVASKLSIKKALAAAPALKMFDTASAKPTTPLTSFGQFAGTTIPVTLTATNLPTATGYQWELPTGVSLVTGSVSPTVTTATFTAEPFLAPTTAPSGVGTKFWVVTYNTYNGVDVNGFATKIVTSTASQRIAGNSTRTYTFTVTAGSTAPVGTTFTYNGDSYTVSTALTSTATSLVATVPASSTSSSLLNAASTTITGTLTRVSDSSTISFSKIALANFYGATTSAPYLQYGTVITSDLPSIIVNFAGATANTVNELYLGVKSLNGVGASITNNNTTANAAAIAANVPGINYNIYTETATPPAIPVSPSAIATNGTSSYSLSGHTPSTAKLLKVVSVLPKASAGIKSLNDAVSVTNISEYLGTTNPLTLTCSAVANASSYTWILPVGVNIVSPTSNTNTITVNYAGIAPGTALVTVAVTANNNIGSSPIKDLKLTAGAPSTPTVSGSLAICPTATSDVVYTIAALATRATSYLITPPAGASVNSGAIDAPATIVAVPGATFTVNYPSGFLSPSTAPMFLNIASVNGFGNNLANRVLKLTNTGAVCGSRVASSSVANGFSVVAYPNPSSSEFTIATSAKGAFNVKVYDMQGRLVESSTSTQVGSRLAKGVYNVIVSQGANTKSVRVIKN